MQFQKKYIKRAIEEFGELLSNVVNSEMDQYQLRIRQLFLLIENNEILNTIISPYINMELDEEKFGLIQNNDSGEDKYFTPEDEDEEIAFTLKELKKISESENEDAAYEYTVNIYEKRSCDENVYLFNKNIVAVAFTKLRRKLQYKIEDIHITENENEPVDARAITIIKINNIHAENSNIAIGKDITQSNENVFEKMRGEINKNIKDEADKTELLSCINELEANKLNKNKLNELYNNFLLKIGTYMNIISPFLPLLFEQLKL
jgi:hypothetical protein